MSDQKVIWFMLKSQMEPSILDFAMFNSSRALRAYKFDGSTITTVGNATVITTLTGDAPNRSGITGVAKNRVVIAGSDQFNNFRIAMCEFDDTDWAIIGNEFQIDSTSANTFPRVAAMSATRVAISTISGLQTYDFDGTDWATVGNKLGAAGSANAMSPISSTRVALINATRLKILDFDGTDWTQFSEFTISTSVSSVATIDAAHWAVLDGGGSGSGGDDLKMYKLVGSTLSQDGNALDLTGETFTTLCALKATRVMLGSANGNDLQAYDWDGSDWTSQGSTLATQGVPEGDNLGQLDNLII